MTTTDDKKILFQDMQQHPEKYSDEQIETLMSEIDENPDVEMAWEEFSAKHPATKEQSAKHASLVWYKIIAASIVILLGIWGFASIGTKTRDYIATTIKGRDSSSVKTNVTSEKGDGTNIAQIINEKDMPQDELLAQITKEEAASNATSPYVANTIHIRGNDSIHGEPIYFVNGHRVQSIRNLKSEDIAKIDVLEGDKAKAKYACYGDQVRNGIIDITLKQGADSLRDAMYWKPQNEGKKVTVSNETFPLYPGGKKELEAFVKKNFKYPTVAKKIHAKGRINVSFIIYKDGTHGEYKYDSGKLKGADGKVVEPAIVRAYAQEIIRVCRLMPRWTPGTLHNKDIDKKYSLSFQFKDQDLSVIDYNLMHIRCGQNRVLCGIYQ